MSEESITKFVEHDTIGTDSLAELIMNYYIKLIKHSPMDTKIEFIEQLTLQFQETLLTAIFFVEKIEPEEE